jgi:hypothetical protein
VEAVGRTGGIGKTGVDMWGEILNLKINFGIGQVGGVLGA